MQDLLELFDSLLTSYFLVTCNCSTRLGHIQYLQIRVTFHIYVSVKIIESIYYCV